MKTLLKARLAQFGLMIADEKTHHTNMGARKIASGERRPP